MLRQILAVFGYGCSKVESAVPTEWQEEVAPPKPKKPFLFQQTLEDWRKAISALPEEYARQDAAHLEAIQRLDEEIQRLGRALPQGQDAQQEMERREVFKLLELAGRMRSDEVTRASNQRYHRYLDLGVGGHSGHLEKAFREAEGKMIVQGGTVLHRKVLQEGRVTGRMVSASCDKYRPEQLDRQERILVVRDGQPYVGEIVFEAVFTTENTRHSGVGGEMAHDICDWVFEGRYRDLQVKWMSPSLAQFSAEELLVLRTYEFAELKHRGQVRAGEKKLPYITHPLAVATLVAEAGGSAEAICAALLHDVMEDCGVTSDQILDLYSNKQFGQSVLAIVQEVTDPAGLPYEKKKERQIAMMASGYSSEAALLKAADQTCNMQDLVATPPRWGKGEEEAYIASMRRLVEARPDINLTIKALFDKAYEEACRFYGMA